MSTPRPEAQANSTLRVTQARVMKSEWTKLRTQPGALWSLLSAVILVVAFGILYSLLRAARPPHGAAVASFDPTSVSLAGVQLAQIAAGVLGVLLITSEYASGLIRTTLAAVPRRLPTLWGEAAVLAAATVAVSVPAAVAVFLAGQSILGRQHLSVSFGDPGVARAVIGSALYLAVAGLLGLALGTLLRSTAGGSRRCSACCSRSRSWSASCRAAFRTRSASTCPARPGWR